MSAARAAVLPVAALLCLCSCSSSDSDPSVVAPAPTGQAAETCTDLDTALPERVEGGKRSQRDAQTAHTAQWGDPAITLRCGVDRPQLLTPGSDTYLPTADAVVVNEVSWLIEEAADGYRFTTTERAVFVEVTVPGAYAPETGALVDLAEAVREQVPEDPLYEQSAG